MATRKAVIMQIQVLPSNNGPVIYAVDSNGNLWMSSADIFRAREWVLLESPVYNDPTK
jgi:hypothetical protein